MSAQELVRAPGPAVLRCSPDRSLSVDEVGSIRLVEEPAQAAA
jgi:hypothetical protein